MAEEERDFSVLFSEIQNGTHRGMLENLVDATRQSIQLMDPWTTARSDLPQVQSIILDMQRLGETYYAAVRNSLDASGRGIITCTDCVELCERILSGRPGHPFRLFVSGLREDTQVAREDAKTVIELFRKMQRQLVDVISGISDVVETLRSSNVDLNLVEFIDIPDQLLKKAKGVNAERFRVMTDRMAVPQNDGEAQSQLFKSQLVVDQLVAHAQGFATWWSNMDVILHRMKNTADGLNPDLIVHSTVRGHLMDWNNAEEMYLYYKATVTQLLKLFKQFVAEEANLDEEGTEIQRWGYQNKMKEMNSRKSETEGR